MNTVSRSPYGNRGRRLGGRYPLSSKISARTSVDRICNPMLLCAKALHNIHFTKGNLAVCQVCALFERAIELRNPPAIDQASYFFHDPAFESQDLSNLSLRLTDCTTGVRNMVILFITCSNFRSGSWSLALRRNAIHCCCLPAF